MEASAPHFCKDPTCSYHAHVPAIARCISCGRYVCSQCRVVAYGRNYCTTCLVAPAGTGYHWPGAPIVPPRLVRELVFPSAPWGVGETLVILFASLATTLFFSLFFYYFAGGGSLSVTGRVLLVFFSSCLLYSFMLGGTFYSVKVRHKISPSALGLKLDSFGKSLTWGIGLGLPTFVVALFFAYLSERVLGPRTDYISQSVSQASSESITVPLITLLFFTLVVLAPMCEEIFFRGYMYPALRNRMGMQPALVLNGLIFAVVHFELMGFLPRFLLGYVLCYIYERNRTLVGPVVGHMLYNGLIIAIAFAFNLF